MGFLDNLANNPFLGDFLRTTGASISSGQRYLPSINYGIDYAKQEEERRLKRKLELEEIERKRKQEEEIRLFRQKQFKLDLDKEKRISNSAKEKISLAKAKAGLEDKDRKDKIGRLLKLTKSLEVDKNYSKSEIETLWTLAQSGDEVRWHQFNKSAKGEDLSYEDKEQIKSKYRSKPKPDKPKRISALTYENRFHSRLKEELNKILKAKSVLPKHQEHLKGISPTEREAAVRRVEERLSSQGIYRPGSEPSPAQDVGRSSASNAPTPAQVPAQGEVRAQGAPGELSPQALVSKVRSLLPPDEVIRQALIAKGFEESLVDQELTSGNHVRKILEDIEAGVDPQTAIESFLETIGVR